MHALAWNSGRAKTWLTPPPPAPYPSFQTTSGVTLLPSASRFSWVPPTLVTSGSVDGQEFIGVSYSPEPSRVALVTPSSPEDARTVTPCTAALRFALRNA